MLFRSPTTDLAGDLVPEKFDIEIRELRTKGRPTDVDKEFAEFLNNMRSRNAKLLQNIEKEFSTSIDGEIRSKVLSDKSKKPKKITKKKTTKKSTKSKTTSGKKINKGSRTQQTKRVKKKSSN